MTNDIASKIFSCFCMFKIQFLWDVDVKSILRIADVCNVQNRKGGLDVW